MGTVNQWRGDAQAKRDTWDLSISSASHGDNFTITINRKEVTATVDSDDQVAGETLASTALKALAAAIDTAADSWEEFNELTVTQMTEAALDLSESAIEIDRLRVEGPADGKPIIMTMGQTFSVSITTTQQGSASGGQKLVPTGTNARNSTDYFGGQAAGSHSIDIDGTTIAVGSNNGFDADGADEKSLAGAVYIFISSGGTWTQQQKLVATGTQARNASDFFGYAVSLDEDTVAIGAYTQDYDASGANFKAEAGAVYVWTRTGTTWSQQQKLVHSDTRNANDAFGCAVAVDVDTLAVGARANGYDASDANLVTGAGSVYVFTRSGGSWTIEQKISADLGTPPNDRVSLDNFGWAVALSGDTLAVGAPFHDYPATDTGSITGATAANPVVITSASHGLSNGNVVRIEDVGGMTEINDREFTVANVTSNTFELSGEDGSSHTAYTSGGTYGLKTSAAGAVYVYLRTGTTWALQQKITADLGSPTNGRNADDEFGYDISLDGDTLVVGARQHDYDASGADSQANAGAAFVYLRTSGVWALQQKIVGSGTNGRIAGDEFGGSVGVDGDKLVIGAKDQAWDASGADEKSQAGAAYYLTRSGATWSHDTKYVGTGTNGRNIGDRFGTSVAIDGSSMVASAHLHDYDADGASPLGDAGAAWELADPQNEKQNVTLSGATGGTFTLTFNSETTSAIAYDASAATVDSEIEALPSMASGDVSVTAIAGGWEVEFTGNFANTNVDQMTGNGTNLTGSTNLTQTQYQDGTGPNYFDDPDNWTLGTAPADDEELVFANSDVDCLYGLSQATVTPESILIKGSYTGNIGLSRHNGSYYEYRDTELRIGTDGDGSNDDIKIYVGEGEGSGSPLIRLNTGDKQTNLYVTRTGSSSEGNAPACIWRGTNASNAVEVQRGDVGIGFWEGDLATVATLKQSFMDSPEADATVVIGNDVTIGTSIVKTGGGLLLECACPDFENWLGDAEIVGVGDIGRLIVKAGTVNSDTTGIIGGYGTITGATAANPVVITSTAHGLATGDKVRIAGVVGMTEINQREFTILRVDANSFQLIGEDGSSHTAYSSGGSWAKLESIEVSGEGTIELGRKLTARQFSCPVILRGEESSVNDPSRVVTTLTQLTGEYAEIRDGVKLVRS